MGRKHRERERCVCCNDEWMEKVVCVLLKSQCERCNGEKLFKHQCALPTSKTTCRHYCSVQT